VSGDAQAELQEALGELDSYLADQVAPLLVTDAIERLLEYPPEVTAEALHGWAATQFRLRGASEPLADLIFHALKKFQQFEEYQLMAAARFSTFLVGLANQLVTLSAPGDRERLEGLLRYLRQERAAHAIPAVQGAIKVAVPIGEAAAREAAAGGADLSKDDLKSLRHFTRLLEEARGLGDGKGGAGGLVAPQLMVLAASGARDADDLRSRMSKLHSAGLAPAVSREVVHALSAAIPDWVLRRGEGVEVVRGESVEAVRRVVKLAGDKARTSERWKDLLRSAAEHFNKGAYGRAVTLLDVAERMIEDKELDTQVASIAKGNAHEAFDLTRLLQAASDPENRPILRRLGEFFPAWSPRELLDQLVYQPDKKKRKFLLAMLEIWGADAHRAVLDRLATVVADGTRDPNAWWYWRNLVFLLHRTPRPEDGDPKQELELAGQFSALGNHPSFQRETFVLLGQLPNGLGAPLLVQRLQQAERAIAEPEPPHELSEMWKILNSLAAALVRTGAPSARRALVEHGLSNNPRAGDTAARLRELGSVDLTSDPEVVRRLLEAVKSLQPVKLLGFLVSRNEESLTHVVRALASTTAPAARRALAELAEKFPDREYGRLAAGGPEAVPERAPERTEPEEDDVVPPPQFREAPPTPPRASLSGDLEIFGLPGLLQNLQQSEAHGRLALKTPDGQERAGLTLSAGRLVECHCGELEAESAFYQIFEQPEPGTFEFVRTEATRSGVESKEMLGLLMEAMRRFDEFQRLRALVPDHALVRPGSEKPSAPEGESDGELMRRLWTALRGTASVIECEVAARVDSFRVRTLLSHWADEGAIEMDRAPVAASLPEFGPSAADD